MPPCPCSCAALPMPAAAADSPDPELDAVLLHIVNHCAKAADLVRKNNERLKAAAAAAGAGGEAEPPRDQGFVRSKVGGRRVGGQAWQVWVSEAGWILSGSTKVSDLPCAA